MEEVASELSFNEDNSLVGEEGEEHCSLEEQQHRQVTLQLLGRGGAQGGGVREQRRMWLDGSRTRLRAGFMCCTEELELTVFAIGSMSSP